MHLDGWLSRLSPCSESRWGRYTNSLCRNRLNLIHTDMGNETDWMCTHEDVEIDCVCVRGGGGVWGAGESASLKANAGIGDIAVWVEGKLTLKIHRCKVLTRPLQRSQPRLRRLLKHGERNNSHLLNSQSTIWAFTYSPDFRENVLYTLFLQNVACIRQVFKHVKTS